MHQTFTCTYDVQTWRKILPSSNGSNIFFPCSLENSNGKKPELLNSLKKKRKERKEGRKETDRSFKCCIQSIMVFFHIQRLFSDKIQSWKRLAQSNASEFGCTKHSSLVVRSFQSTAFMRLEILVHWREVRSDSLLAWFLWKKMSWSWTPVYLLT